MQINIKNGLWNLPNVTLKAYKLYLVLIWKQLFTVRGLENRRNKMLKEFLYQNLFDVSEI